MIKVKEYRYIQKEFENKMIKKKSARYLDSKTRNVKWRVARQWEAG